MYTNTKQSEAGMALVVATFALVGIAILVAALSSRVVSHTENANSDLDVKMAYAGLEAGLSRSLAELDRGEDGVIGVRNVKTEYVNLAEDDPVPGRVPPEKIPWSDVENRKRSAVDNGSSGWADGDASTSWSDGNASTPWAEGGKSTRFGGGNASAPWSDGNASTRPADTNNNGPDTRFQTTQNTSVIKIAKLGSRDLNFDHSDVVPERAGNSEYFAYARHWGFDGLDNDGDGIADDNGERNIISVTAMARVRNRIRRVDVVLERTEARSIWDNAILGGRGDTSKQSMVIRGDFFAHGSVYIHGDKLRAGDHAFSLETGYIRNNYEGLPNDILERIPALPNTDSGRNTEASLGAELWVENGFVGLSSLAEAGQPEGTLKNAKELLDGIYVADGFTGAITGDKQSLPTYSDEPPTESFDAPSKGFPTFSDDNGRDFRAHYTNDFGDPDTRDGAYQYKEGNLSIKTNENFFWDANQDAARDPVVNKPQGSAGMPTAAEVAKRMEKSDDFFVWFDADTNQLVVNGRIAVDGDITFEDASGNDKTIYYDGKGSLMAMDASKSSSEDGSRRVEIKTDLISRNMDGSSKQGFPEDNLLAIMSDNVIEVLRDDLRLMGAFYAQDLVRVDSANVQIYGSIAGNRMNLKNPPTAVHVPRISESWTEEMRVIGSETGYKTKKLAWSERGTD